MKLVMYAYAIAMGLLFAASCTVPNAGVLTLVLFLLGILFGLVGLMLERKAVNR